jgi:hypothetical protein
MVVDMLTAGNRQHHLGVVMSSPSDDRFFDISLTYVVGWLAMKLIKVVVGVGILVGIIYVFTQI